MARCHHSGLTSVATALGLIAAVLFAGCAGPREAPPTVAEMTFRASANLNPGVTGQPAPLVVRVYELAAAGNFTDSDFFALFDSDTAVLGADQLGREELRLVPGAERRINKTVQPGTRFIGIMAAYRQIDQVRWREVVELRAEQVNRFEVRLGDKELAVSRKN
jgi:type VI secretion system protein VasD